MLDRLRRDESMQLDELIEGLEARVGLGGNIYGAVRAGVARQCEAVAGKELCAVLLMFARRAFPVYEASAREVSACRRCRFNNLSGESTISDRQFSGRRMGECAALSETELKKSSLWV